jgi:hypothetical protein
MATAVRVAATVPGARRAGTAEHPVEVGLSGRVPLRELLAAVVRAEVAAYLDRAEQRSLVRVLTERSLAEAVGHGAVRPAPPEQGPEPTPGAGPARAVGVDADEAVATALLAFTDGLYHVFVDDEQVEDIERVVEVGPDTRLLFLRLVPLAGG